METINKNLKIYYACKVGRKTIVSDRISDAANSDKAYLLLCTPSRKKISVNKSIKVGDILSTVHGKRIQVNFIKPII